MRSRLIATGLISAVLLAVIPANSLAAQKYQYTTYRQGQNWAKTWLALGMESQEKWFSPTTGRIIYSKLIAYCKQIYNTNTGDKVMSVNAQKGCADEIKKWYG